MQAIVGFAMAFIVGFLFIGTGIGLSISSVVTLILNEYEEIPSWIIYMLSSGVGCLVVGGVATTAINCASYIYELAAFLAIVNVFVLSDKKVGYILSIVIGVLTLLGASFWIGLFILLGGIFGLVALTKEKKQEQQALEMEKVK